MTKKAQGLPINTIIIAILALLVFVVIFLIFTGKIRIFGGELASCTGKGGFCTGSDCYSGFQTEIKDTDCGTEKCCLNILPAPKDAPCKVAEHCISKNCTSNKCG